MTQLAPPRWAEWLLRLSVKPTEYDNVSGDLLEEYRESVLPALGHRRADLWYAGQVLVFMFNAAKLWGVLFGAAFIARTALDWFVPTVDFHSARSCRPTWQSALWCWRDLQPPAVLDQSPQERRLA